VDWYTRFLVNDEESFAFEEDFQRIPLQGRLLILCPGDSFVLNGDFDDLARADPLSAVRRYAVQADCAFTEHTVDGRKGKVRQGTAEYAVQAASVIIFFGAQAFRHGSL
jgi:hypothetical protein